MSHPEIPPKLQAYLKRLFPYTNPKIPDTIRQKAKRLYPAHAQSIDGWHWWGNVNKCVLALCDLDSGRPLSGLDRDNTRHPRQVSIRPTKRGECSLTFITLVSHDLEIIFPTMQEAKGCLDNLLAAPTPEIPPTPELLDELSEIPLDTAATLKRISPYYGPSIPGLVKDKEISFSEQPYNPDKNGWQWDCGSGVCRWELDLCGMIDPDLVDPIGYVALTPLEGGRCTLAFNISSSEWPEGVDVPDDMTFPSVESAKNYLDSVLAVATSPFPKPLNISELPPETLAGLKEWHPNGEWQWCDYPGWQILLRRKGSLGMELGSVGGVAIVPYRNGGPFNHIVKPKDWHDEWMIQFVGDCALYNFFLFRGTLGEAKRSIDALLAAETPEIPHPMSHPEIPPEIRAKLKRLSPYAGPFVPDSVRENAKNWWGPDHHNHGGWRWDDGGEIFQCELLLCDMDARAIDPAGYVAIIPLKEGCYVEKGPTIHDDKGWRFRQGFDEYALSFVCSLKWEDQPSLIFPTTQAAKEFLDALLAANTPEIP